MGSGGEHSDLELALRSGGEHFDRGGGPAGNILILSLRWRSGREHSDPGLWWRSGGEQFDPAVAVGVRRGAEEGGRKAAGGRKEEAGRLT